MTGAAFSNASNLGYGNRSRVAFLVRTRRWSAEVGFDTVGDGYDDEGNFFESDDEDDEGQDYSRPPVESRPPFPSDAWAGDSAYEDAMLDTPSRGRASDMGMDERTPVGSQASQYVGYLVQGLNPEGGDWLEYGSPTPSQVPSRSHTPGSTDMEDEEPYRQSFGYDGAGDERSGGEEGGGGESGGEASDGDGGGQEESDAEDGDESSSDSSDSSDEQSGDGDGSQYSEPAPRDAEEEDGDSSDEQAQAQPPTRRRGPVVLTPAGGLPNQEYAGRITRRMTVAQRAHSAPLAPGQGYPSVPIAESQAAQMLLGQYGGEPDSEDDKDDENSEDDKDDEDSEDEDGEIE